VTARRIRPSTQIKHPGDETKVLLGNGEWGDSPVPPAAVSYTHSQSIASATWTITHNLGYVPNVWVKDSAGTIIEDGGVDVIDLNTIRLNFGAAFGGVAYLS